MRRLLLPCLIALSIALLVGCPPEPDDDDSAPPIDDDDVTLDDDDSSGDDDDVTPPPEWAQPDEAFATFVGGGSELGAVLAGGFDVDDDGAPELAFGCPDTEGEGKGGIERGTVYLFFGTTVAAPGDFDMTDADVVIHGENDYDEFGTALAALGDIDGDGRNDLAIASGTRANTWIFFGSTLAAGGVFGASQADVIVGEQVAECVRWVGDLDGDGLSELLIANTLNSSAGNVAGRAFVMAGATLGAGGGVTVNDAWVNMPGNMAGFATGCESGGAGDVDGDGLDDLLVSTQGAGPGGANSGRVDLFLGSTLVGIVGGGDVPLGSHDLLFPGEAPDDRLGTDVRALGDLDGDGRSDLLLSARQNDTSATDAGKTYLVRAAAMPTEGSYVLSGAPAFLGEAGSDRSGSSIAALGDVDGDGLPDLAIGAPRNDAGGDDAGAVYVILGATAMGATAFPLSSANAVLRGVEVEGRFGDRLVAAGDVDGDGLGDLLVGAPRALDEAGKVYLFASPYGD
jgi:hypothetical protein